MADGLLQDAGHLAVRRCYARVLHHLADLLPVKEQIVRVQHRHQARILEGQQTGRGRAPGQQQEPPVRAVPDQIAQGVPLILLQSLQVIQHQHLPVSLPIRQGEIRLVRAQIQAGQVLRQLLCQTGLSKAAGGTEKQHPPLLHKPGELLRHGRFHYNILRHLIPSLCGKPGSCGKILRSYLKIKMIPPL